MKKNSQIIKSNLSTLLKKFAKTNVIEKIDDGNLLVNVVNILTTNIRDNHYLSDIEIDSHSLENLEKDIIRHGIISPLLVREVENQEYELITGRKRLYCVKKLGISSIACVVQNFTDENMLLYMLFSYGSNKSQSVIEIANLCKILTNKFNYTQNTLAEILDVSRSQITNYIRILNLPKSIQNDIVKGKLSYGHAKILASLKEEDIYPLVNLIYEKQLSVRDVEYLVNEYKTNAGYDSLIASFEKRNHLKAKVTGKQLILSFKNKKELKKFMIKK